MARVGRRRRRGVVALVLTGAGVVLLGAPAAVAADPPPPLVIRKVDATTEGSTIVTFTYEGKAADLGSLEVAENGKSAPASGQPVLVDQANGGTATVIVIDASATTENLLLDQFKQSALDLLTSSQGSGVAAIISANQTSSLRQGFTNDPGLLANAVNSIVSSNDGGLWNGVDRATRILRDNPTLMPNIVVLTDGNARVPQADPGVVAAVLASGASFYAVGVQTGSLDPTSFQALAARTGGRYVETDSPTGVTAPATEIGRAVAATYQVTYSSNANVGLNTLALQAGGSLTKVSFVAGSTTLGASALTLQETTETSGRFEVAYFREHGKELGLVLATLAAVLGAYAVGMIFVRNPSGLSRVLQPYSDGYGNQEEEGEEGQSAAQTALIQRAVQLTSRFAERQGFLVKVELALERANLPLRAAEALFFYVAAAAVFTLLVLVISRSLLVVVAVAVIAVMLPPGILSYMAGRRKKQFQAQLPDMLQLMSGTLRAGYSMMQGVEAVSQEVAEPMGRELRRVVTEARLGRPLEASLDAVAERMDSPDFAWAVMAIRIQREVGGNLAELLLTVAETMIARERLRRDIAALTAEGKVSAIVLGALPVLLGLAMYGINPEYMGVLIHESIGHVLLFAACALAFFGFWWMKKVIEIEV